MKRLERDVIDFVIDDVLATSRAARRRRRRIREEQETLRGLIDARAWSVYLNLDALFNEQATKEMRALFKRLLRIYMQPRP